MLLFTWPYKIPTIKRWHRIFHGQYESSCITCCRILYVSNSILDEWCKRSENKMCTWLFPWLRIDVDATARDKDVDETWWTIQGQHKHVSVLRLRKNKDKDCPQKKTFNPQKDCKCNLSEMNCHYGVNCLLIYPIEIEGIHILYKKW